MPAPNAPSHENSAPPIPADTYDRLIRTLRLLLPPPLTNSAEDLARRDHAAIARIAALCPANAAEADLAVLYVVASEHWKQRLSLIPQSDAASPWAMKCRAEAIAQMRQAQTALRLLLRLQASR